MSVVREVESKAQFSEEILLFCDELSVVQAGPGRVCQEVGLETGAYWNSILPTFEVASVAEPEPIVTLPDVTAAVAEGGVRAEGACVSTFIEEAVAGVAAVPAALVAETDREFTPSGKETEAELVLFALAPEPKRVAAAPFSE